MVQGSFAGNRWQASSLGEAIHTFSNFDIYIAVVDEALQIIEVHDIVGYHVNWNSHVLVLHHWGAEVEIFEIREHHFCARS